MRACVTASCRRLACQRFGVPPVPYQSYSQVGEGRCGPITPELAMIRVVMFDLGRTLVDETRRPFPHVEDALAAIAEFKTEDGKPLQSCLVSDFEVSDRPVTE